MEKGREEGIEEGIEKANLKTAQKLLAEKIELEIISKCTGLSIEALKKIQ